MKLLVPVDGSKASIGAVKKAVEIAEKYGFTIKILTVIDEDHVSRLNRNMKLWRQVDGSIISGIARTEDKEEIIGEIRQDAFELLDTIIEQIDFGDLKPEKEVLFGEPYHMILELAKAGNYDLIVMANRGHSRIKSFFTGSVTQRVISEAPCPVLVIHADAEG
ncbi:MAG: universal stress protein [Bacillota bacterium]